MPEGKKPAEDLYSAKTHLHQPVPEVSTVNATALPADAPPGEKHAWHMYVVRLSDDARVTRDEVIQRLSDAGIGTSVHYLPLHRQPYWRDRYSLRAEDYPVADKAFERMISIPLYTTMTDDDQTRVIAELSAILR